MERVGNFCIFFIQFLLFSYEFQFNFVVIGFLIVLVLLLQSNDARASSLLNFTGQFNVRLLSSEQSLHVFVDVGDEILNVAEFIQLQQQTKYLTLSVLLIELDQISLLFCEILQ